MRSTRTITLIAIAALLLAGAEHPARGQGDSGLLNGGRLIRSWDFEEALEHLEPVPRNWYRGIHDPPRQPRPGFPNWNLAAFDESVSSSGQVSVKLPTRGGSTSLLLAGGVVPAMPEGEYVVTCKVRTDGLVHARARVVAGFLTGSLEEIEDSVARSDLLLTDGSWQDVRVELHAHPDAAWIRIELQVLQPDQYVSRSVSDVEALHEDVDGAAWFDDLEIYQIPRVSVRADAEGGLAVGEQPPVIEAVAQDLAGEQLFGRITILDIEGREVAQLEDEISPAGRKFTWRPPLERFGWYSAELHVLNSNGVIGNERTTFVWAPPRATRDYAEQREWGLELGVLPEEVRDDVVSIIERLHTGIAMVPVWPERLDVVSFDAYVEEISPMIDRLLDMGQQVVFVLERLPAGLARATETDPDNPLGALAAEGEAWHAHLDRILAKYGERVRRWQLGATGSDRPFWRDDLAGDLGAVTTKLRRLVPRPLPTLPWRIDYPTDTLAEAPAALTVTVPGFARPEVLDEAIDQLPRASEVGLFIPAPDHEAHGAQRATIEFVKRLVLARAAGSRRILTPQPWRIVGEERPEVRPDPTLGALGLVIDELAGRRYLGELPVADGVRALIFGGRGGGLLVAWNNWAYPEDAVIDAYLGASAIETVDMFGNRAPVESPGPGQNTRIMLDERPLFIEGIDTELALFRSLLRMEPDFIQARTERHHTELVVENPWPVHLTGKIRIARPEEWTIQPRVSTLSIAPGESVRIPLEIGFGVSELAGKRTISADVQLTTERSYPVLEMPVTVEIGLDDIRLIPTLRFADGRGGPRSDVIVSLQITNMGTETISMHAFLQAPGRRGLRSPVSALAPGESVVRHFRMEGAAEDLRGREIRVGLKELDGTGRLNKTLLVQ